VDGRLLGRQDVLLEGDHQGEVGVVAVVVAAVVVAAAAEAVAAEAVAAVAAAVAAVAVVAGVEQPHRCGYRAAAPGHFPHHGVSS